MDTASSPDLASPPDVRPARLLPVAPYDFALSLAYLRTSPSAVLERITDNGVYERALLVDEHGVLLRLWSEGTVEAPALALEVRGEGITPEIGARAAALARRIFALDEDPAGFFALGARDAVLGGLLRRWPGIRPLLIADPFECLLWAVIGQQINVAFARTLKRALIAHCGRSLVVGGVTYPLAPRPGDVAALDPAALRALHFSGRKAEYVIGLARAVAEGAIRFEALRALPAVEAVALLSAQRGVGRWTAEYVLMRGLGARDVLPAGDLGLRAVIGRAYGLGRTATETELRARAEAWAGWRGWAAFAWWLALQEGVHF